MLNVQNMKSDDRYAAITSISKEDTTLTILSNCKRTWHNHAVILQMMKFLDTGRKSVDSTLPILALKISNVMECINADAV